MVVSLPELYDCYDKNGQPANKSNLFIDLSSYPPYRLSDTQNNLTVLGCDTYALISDGDRKFQSGCISYCSERVDFTRETTCSGYGCCQASIPKGLKKLRIFISSIDRHASVSEFNPCGLAFVVDRKSFNISARKLPSYDDVDKRTDVVLDWMIGWNVTCEQAKLNPSAYGCGNNTECHDYVNGPGYRCFCKAGYLGNPYNRNHGCQDINECKDPQKYPYHGKCQNQPGNYPCGSPSRVQGDDKGNPHQKPPLIIPVAVTLAAVFSITVSVSISVTWKWRIKKINFRRNGGEHLKRNGVHIFTKAELAKATNNYDDSKKLSDDGFGSVYKGTIAEGIEVAVKKPKDGHKSLIKREFWHELRNVTQINDKNVVKLKGICLETRIPLLVYEYISSDTLYQHIHPNPSTILKSWKTRLKIAAEAALALDRMHYCAKPPIIHGNIKSANILVDHNCLVKVSDFGTSVLISPEHCHIIATETESTLGYIDPEYLTTGKLTIKSDIYSFGVVLVELLTGKKPSSSITKSEEPINIIHCFISSVKGKTPSDVINFEGASEDEIKKLGTVAEIAVECLNQSSAKRPAMREVARRLAEINPKPTVEENNEETVFEVGGYIGPSLQTSSCLSCLGMESSCSCV